MTRFRKKDRQTCPLEPVDWFHDHGESPKGRPRSKKACCYRVCTLRIARIVVTVDVRLSLRATTVRRLNRHRLPEHRIPFRSKNSLARRIVEALRSLLPKGRTVRVPGRAFGNGWVRPGRGLVLS